MQILMKREIMYPLSKRKISISPESLEHRIGLVLMSVSDRPGCQAVVKRENKGAWGWQGRE